MDVPSEKGMTVPFWYDGRLYREGPLAIAPDDPALLFGATVFSTLRVYDRSLDHPLTAWQAHCDRLRQSLQRFQWQAPDWRRLRQGAEQLTPQFPVLRLTLWPDGRELIGGRPLPPDLSVCQRQGIVAWVAEAAIARSLPAHKTGNYLAPYLALAAARGQGAGEAILADPSGRWLETSTGNLWGWDGECWHTPPLEDGILPGIGRSQLAARLQAQGIPVVQVPWTATLRSRLRLLAYSNCVVQVVPIHTVLDGQIRLEYRPNTGALAMLRAVFGADN